MIIHRPTRSDTLLGVAALYAARSTCNRLFVGAVIARKGRILTTGYNGAPSGMIHCDHQLHHTGDPCKRENCSCSEPCQIAVHAEVNCIAFAARYGISTEECTLYITHTPCFSCAKLLINAGITKVIYTKKFRDMRGIELLRNAGVQVNNGKDESSFTAIS